LTDEYPVEPKSLGRPTVEQCKVVYRSMFKPTVRTFHAKLLEAGYDLARATAQRFIAKHMTDAQPKPKAQALIQFPADELSQIQQDLTELRALDAAALKPMFEKEVLVYNIMLMRFSQRIADRLAMAPKETALLVKAMIEATSKISVTPIPVSTPDGRTIDVAPNEVVDAIDAYFRAEGIRKN
jgi:hypothetical protein